MFRFSLAVTFSLATVVTLSQLSRWMGPGVPSTLENIPLPPAEPRPPGMSPSALWLPELKRYQYARREALKQGTDFRSRLDLSTRRNSRQKLYRVTVRERPEPVVLNEFQTWLLHVENAEGQPVSGAELNVSGGMPQHGHGLPTQPKIAAAGGPGDYRVDGLEFSMPGWWEVHVHVSKDRREDTATFNLIVE